MFYFQNLVTSVGPVLETSVVTHARFHIAQQ